MGNIHTVGPNEALIVSGTGDLILKFVYISYVLVAKCSKEAIRR